MLKELGGRMDESQQRDSKHKKNTKTIKKEPVRNEKYNI